MDQVALMNVLAPAQPRAAHAAAIEHMGEAALDHFSASAHRVPPDTGFQPRAVGVNGLPRRFIAMPPQIPFEGFGSASRVFQTPPSRSFSPSRE